MKSILRKVGKEFIFGGHITSLQSPFALLSLNIMGGYIIHFALFVILYSLSQVIYSYNHLREIYFDTDSNPERAAFNRRNNKKQKILFVIYFIGLLSGLFFTNLSVIALTILVLVAGFLYTEYFKTLKITGFKNYCVAVIWSSILFILPLSQNEAITDTFILIVFMYCLTVFTNTIFFDIKDMESDYRRDVRTFPVVLGLKKTEFLLYVIKLICALLVVIGVYMDVLPSLFLFYLLPILYSIVYINRGFRLQDKKLRILTYLIPEAEFTFWLIVLITAEFLFI